MVTVDANNIETLNTAVNNILSDVMWCDVMYSEMMS